MAYAKRTYYEKHREEQLQRLRELNTYRKENRLCIRCGEPLRETKTLTCEVCLEKRRLQDKNNWQNTTASRQKYYYRNKDKILNKYKERYQERKQHGLCVQCGNPQAAHSTAYCEDCLSKQKKRRSKKINNQQGL